MQEGDIIGGGGNDDACPVVHELFVSGRVCLLGEHSDWAGGFRTANKTIGKGHCLVVGTLEGLHCRVTRAPAEGTSPTLRMTSMDGDGDERRTCELPLHDPAALLAEAQSGGFWAHVAGTCHHLVTQSQHASIIAEAKHGLCIDNYRTTLPVKKGLSSSAAVCVVVARAFSRAYDLACTTRDEMEIAYHGERTTPSKCGRMDQACAFGPGSVCLLTFDGDHLTVDPVEHVGADLHLVVADLDAAKDTVVILRDLQTAYPHPTSAIHEGVHTLLGEMNEKFVSAAVRAIAGGDVEGLGGVYTQAQDAFDVYAGAACPAELRAPKLHRVLRHPAMAPHVHGGKGVGSQGDGTVQFLCRGAEGMEAAAEVLARDFGLSHILRVVVPSNQSPASR